MNKGAAGAIALILLWIAFACFFTAFHPGGLQINGHAAQNPRDVILWFIQWAAHGRQQANPQSTAAEIA